MSRSTTRSSGCPPVLLGPSAGKHPELLILACAAALTCSPAVAQAIDTAGSLPEPRPVGTMSELMVDILYPTSDAVFYIETRTPADEEGWLELERKTLMLAETANLLMTPERRWDEDRWMQDAKLLLDAGEAAYRAAKERDVQALRELNGRLYEACVRCHEDYRPDYGRRR